MSANKNAQLRYQILDRCFSDFRSLIFSFMPDVEVLDPKWYRESFKKKIEENLKKYLNNEV